MITHTESVGTCDPLEHSEIHPEIHEENKENEPDQIQNPSYYGIKGVQQQSDLNHQQRRSHAPNILVVNVVNQDTTVQDVKISSLFNQLFLIK